MGSQPAVNVQPDRISKAFRIQFGRKFALAERGGVKNIT